MLFHNKCGSQIILSKDKKSATRNNEAKECNNGLLFSNLPIKPNSIFEVTIIQKLSVWNGMLKIGVVSQDPDSISLPLSATYLKKEAWLLSGSSLIHNTCVVCENYAFHLDQLNNGDKVGVMLTSSGVLHFFKNGVNMGPAFSAVPLNVWVVVDLLSNNVQVSISETLENTSHNSMRTVNSSELLFHEHHGSLACLSPDKLTAERMRAYDEFNNGVVMTNRPIKDGELFEIRIDKLVDKWSGSIEVGITSHSPDNLEIPTTMTNMRSGTIIMSGNGILVNGKGTKRQYGEFNLDELKEGDRIGLRRNSQGELNYFINGVDQGVAAINVASNLWGVVDLYGMTVKVTIVPEDLSLSATANSHALPFIDLEEKQNNQCCFAREHGLGIYYEVDRLVATNYQTNAIAESRNSISNTRLNSPDELSFLGDMNALINLTHNMNASSCSKAIGHRNYAAIRRGGTLGDEEASNSRESIVNHFVSRIHRLMDWSMSGPLGLQVPKVEDAVLMSDKPLSRDQLWQFKIQSIQEPISIAIGVVNIEPFNYPSLKYPFAHNHEFSSWIQQGSSFIVNGVVSELNDLNFDELTSDCVIGIMISSDNALHFYINGADMGAVHQNIPEGVYLFMNLGSPKTKVSILQTNSTLSSSCTSYEELKDIYKNKDTKENCKENFHTSFYLISSNLCLSNHNQTVCRNKYHDEALVIISNKIYIGEQQKISIKNVDSSLSGSLAIGIFCSLNEIDCDSNNKKQVDKSGIRWMIGHNNGKTNLGTFHWPCRFSAGNTVCVQRLAEEDFVLKVNDCYVQLFTIDNCKDKKCYLICDLNGSVSEITLLDPVVKSRTYSQTNFNSLDLPLIKFTFNEKTGSNISLSDDGKQATRKTGFDNAVIITSQCITANQSFQIKLNSCESKWVSSLSIGLVQLNEMSKLKWKAPRNAFLIEDPCWLFRGFNIFSNNCKLSCTLTSNLEQAEKGCLIKLVLDSLGGIHIFKNNEEITPNTNVRLKEFAEKPDQWYVVVDLYGKVKSVSICDGDEKDDSEEMVECKTSMRIEKEDISELKDNSEPRPRISPHPKMQSCAYLKTVVSFKNSLYLPSHFFHKSDPTCYCKSCILHKESSIPVGWVLFPLKFPWKLELKHSAVEKWHRCYKRLSAWAVRRVLDAGHLMAAGEASNPLEIIPTNSSNKQSFSEKNVPENFQEYPPITVYSSLNFSSPNKHSHLESTAVCATASAVVAIQAFIKPGSYTSHTSESSSQQLPSESNETGKLNKDVLDCLEWTTKERGSIVFSALLIRLL